MSEREDRSDARQTKSEKQQHHFRNRVAFLVSMVAIGCTLALFQINHAAEVRSDRNSCALNEYVELQAQRLTDLKLPGYKAQVEDLKELQTRLRPPTKDCHKVFPPRTQ